MNAFRNSSKLVMLVLVVLISAFGCKSKKKAMEAEKAKQEQEAALRQQQEEEARMKEAEEAERRKSDEASKTNARYTILRQYFDSIATANDLTSANNSISEALTMFASPDTPVLIVISESGGQKDYDRPTTIKDYLNYLKDQKKNINKISNLQFDDNGKITEVELMKN